MWNVKITIVPNKRDNKEICMVFFIFYFYIKNGWNLFKLFIALKVVYAGLVYPTLAN